LLERKTWHAITSTNTFDLVRYWYANGRPSRVEVASTSSDLQYVYGYNTYYLQYNWHGDAVTYIALDGSGGGSWGAYDPWGNPTSWPPPALAAWNYYRWNGAWGYLRLDTLNLYYVHGRWYNPDTGLFLSPDEQGSYKYNAQQDAINSAQGDPCENRKPPVTPPVGGMVVNWIREDPRNNFPDAEIESIRALRPDILACASRHNTVKTNMDDDAFAALMTAILHWEGKLPGTGKTPEDQKGDREKDTWALRGFNISTGIAKIKPSVAVQILRGEIPGFRERYCYEIEGGSPWTRRIAQLGGSACDERGCWDPRFIFAANELAIMKMSLEYLAANLERGADRVNTLGYQASVFNLALWHNRGIQTPAEFSAVPRSELSYGNVMLATMPTAMRVLGIQGRYLPHNPHERDFVEPWLRIPR
jgi:hypothetical protein